ncbi:MAG TPA: sulfite exporter TauE/SafE family protein [Candidatus Aveggerthella excrementigallinarum]|nr:sulfite exporter TauE/SafE family protein [Candidatus Aveggerthella excrementigallinarum]
MDIGAFIAAAVVGLVVGVLSGLLGIGGGTMMVPVFRLGFGLEAIQATATSLFTIIPTSLSGCVTHVRNKTCIVPIGVAAGVGGALTSPVGVWLASMSPAWLIMLAAALIIGYSAFNMLRKAFKKPKAAPAQAAATRAGANAAEASAADANGAPADMAPVAAHAESSAFSVERKHLFMGVAIGLTAGLASGYVGVGGGFIMVPMFLSLLSLPMKKTSGTSLIAVTILAIPGVIEQAMLGHIDFVAGIAMAVGSIPGAVLGAQLMKRVPERALRIFFGVFLLIMAVVLVVNEFAAA